MLQCGWYSHSDEQFWVSTKCNALCQGQRIKFWTHDISKCFPDVCWVSKWFHLLFFLMWRSSWHSSIKPSFVECLAYGCPMNNCSHLSCFRLLRTTALQLLQRYLSPLGCRQPPLDRAIDVMVQSLGYFFFCLFIFLANKPWFILFQNVRTCFDSSLVFMMLFV